MEESRAQYIVDEKGRKIAVILPIDEYKKMLENLHDLKIISERKNEPTVRFEEIKKKLKEDGFL